MRLTGGKNTDKLKVSKGEFKCECRFYTSYFETSASQVTGSSDTLFSLDYLEVALNVNVTPNS